MVRRGVPVRRTVRACPDLPPRSCAPCRSPRGVPAICRATVCHEPDGQQGGNRSPSRSADRDGHGFGHGTPDGFAMSATATARRAVPICRTHRRNRSPSGVPCTLCRSPCGVPDLPPPSAGRSAMSRTATARPCVPVRRTVRARPDLPPRSCAPRRASRGVPVYPATVPRSGLPWRSADNCGHGAPCPISPDGLPRHG